MQKKPEILRLLWDIIVFRLVAYLLNINFFSIISPLIFNILGVTFSSTLPSLLYYPWYQNFLIITILTLLSLVSTFPLYITIPTLLSLVAIFLLYNHRVSSILGIIFSSIQPYLLYYHWNQLFIYITILYLIFLESFFPLYNHPYFIILGIIFSSVLPSLLYYPWNQLFVYI